MLLFYSRRLYAGLGFDANGLVLHRYGLERRQKEPAGPGNRLFLRLTNDNHIVTLHHSADGTAWTKFGVQMEVSGYHHNVAGDFLEPASRPVRGRDGRGEIPQLPLRRVLSPARVGRRIQRGGILRRHVEQVPVARIERPRRRLLHRITVDVALAVDDDAAALGNVGDQADVVKVAIPRARTGVVKHVLLDGAGRHRRQPYGP